MSAPLAGTATARADTEATAPSRLEAAGLHLRHPGAERDVVRDVHLRVEVGEILCLVGPNGSGKSTTLAALGRELAPRLGVVTLDGADAWSVPRKAFARRVARLPQEPVCPEGLTVEELVASALCREMLLDVFAIETELTAGAGAPRLDVLRPADPRRNL